MQKFTKHSDFRQNNQYFADTRLIKTLAALIQLDASEQSGILQFSHVFNNEFLWELTVYLNS